MNTPVEITFLLGKSPKVTDEPIMKIINNPQDTKLRQFTQEKPNIIQREIENRKAAGLNDILPELWKTRKFDYILL